MIMIQQMMILAIIMVVGFTSSKLGIINSEASKKITSLVVNITNPCFIISSVLGNTEVIKKSDVLVTLGLSISMYVILIIIGFVIPYILRVPKKSYGIYRAMTVFSNLGFMGAPIVAGLYGNEALLFVALFILPYNLLIYSYGVLVMKTESNKADSLKLGNMINPGTVASVLAIVIYLFQIKVPTVISSSVQMIGNVTAPISMMIIGTSFVTLNMRKVFTNYKLILFCFIKLLVIPTILVLVARNFVQNEMLVGILLVMCATPIGSMVPMMAAEYGGDAELGATGVAISSVLSVITLSILFVVLGI